MYILIINELKENLIIQIIQNSNLIFLQKVSFNIYSDDSLIRAPIVRKSRLSGQKVWEPISTSAQMGDSVIRKNR